MSDEPALEELRLSLNRAVNFLAIHGVDTSAVRRAAAALAEMEALRESLIRMGEHYDKAAAESASWRGHCEAAVTYAQTLVGEDVGPQKQHNALPGYLRAVEALNGEAT